MRKARAPPPPAGTAPSPVSSGPAITSDEKERVLDKFVRHRSKLNEKGVFDDATNTVRAQTLMQYELGRIVDKKRQGEEVAFLVGSLGKRAGNNKGGAGGNKQSASNSTSRADALEQRLDAMHDAVLKETGKVVNERRTKERTDRIRATLSGTTRSGEDLPPSSLPSGPAGKPAATPGPQPPQQPPRSSSATRGVSAGSLLTPSSAQGSPVPPPASSQGDAARKGTAVPSGGATATTGAPPSSALGVADWMQRAMEHAQYPNAEKELRLLHRKRDEAHRGATPVERYASPWMHSNPQAKGWNASSAHPLMEELFVPTSLSEYQRAGAISPPAAVTSPNTPAGTAVQQHVGRTDYSRVAQEHDALLSQAPVTRKRRIALKQERQEELTATQGLLQAGLHVREPQQDQQELGGGSLDDGKDAQSSDEDDDGVELEALHRSSVKALMHNTDGNVDMEACELVECVVVCLCEEARRKRDGAGPTRDIAVLRSILIHGLVALTQTIRAECDRRQQQAAAVITGAPSRRRVGANAATAEAALAPSAASYRLLRSWTKGVETLLLLDLDTGGLPFSLLNDEHMGKFVEVYCLLHRRRKARTDELMQRWRSNREVALSTHLGGTGGKPLRQGPTVSPSKMQTIQASNDLINYFRTTSRVTADDLSKLDDAEANVKYRQRELAQTFLARFEGLLPTASKSPNDEGGRSATPQGDKDTAPSPRGERNQAPQGPPRGGRSPVMMDAAPAASSGTPSGPVAAEAATPATTPRQRGPRPLKTEPTGLKLRTVLLKYVGLLNGGEGVEAPFLSAAHSSAKTVSAFVNVFKTTWGRTPLGGNVAPTEATQRAQVLEDSNILAVLDAYLLMLSPTAQDSFRFRVKAERIRVAKMEKQLAEEARAFARATNEETAEEKELKLRLAALHAIEKQQLVDKYTRSADDREKLERLKRAIEASDEWFQYEASRREAASAVAASAKPGATNIAAGSEQLLTPRRDDGTASEGDQSQQQGGGSQSNAGTVRAVNISQQNRIEVMRIKRLQELEGCWQALKIAYSLRIPLHDKWNNADIKAIDKAVRLYKECLAAVNVREAALDKVMENEKNPDAKERVVMRHTLFSEMCGAGQACEVLARKLQQETGDTLMYQETMYSIKLKEDFAVVSKLLRAGK